MTRRINRPTDHDGGPVALLAAILTDLPNRPDAACRSLAPMFDADQLDDEDDTDRQYRLIAAERVCRRCPHTTACPDSLATRPHRRTA